ncbi:cytochrome P450 [Maricaulaceae bacterium MS644]
MTRTKEGAGAASRPPETLFAPAAVRPMADGASALERMKALRDNPISVLPDAVYRSDHHIAPLGSRSVHYLAGPDAIRAVMQDDFQAWRKSPLIMRMLRPILGDAILTAHGESWRRQRMTLQPALFKKRIARFAPLMTAAGRGAVARLSAGPQPVEVHGVMNDSTFTIIEQALFSDTEGFDRAAVRGAIERLLEEIGRLRYSDLLPFPEWAPRNMSPGGRAALKTFRTAAMAQIRRRRSAQRDGVREDRAGDLLSLLMDVRDEETKAGLSDTDIRDTLMTFVAAGHETTAIALTWSLYCLAHDQEAQGRVRTEAEHVFSGVEDPGAAESAQLVFTRQVIEEALRLFPPAPALGRRAVRDTKIGETAVKKGDMALLAFYALHRNPAYWDHPDRFDPDRFSPERRPVDRYRFMAFGGGPRACVGSQFAMMEASLILAQIVAALDVDPVDEIVEPVMQVTLRPRGGLRLAFTPRR